MSVKRIFEFKFAIGSKGSIRSSAFVVWMNEDKDDIYIAPLGDSIDYKTSLHQKGHSHTGFTSELAKKRKMKLTRRHVDKWTDQTIVHPNTSHLFRLIIPARELSTFTEEVDLVEYWMPLPPPDSVLVIEFAFGILSDFQSQIADGKIQIHIISSIRCKSGKDFLILGGLIDGTNILKFLDRVKSGALRQQLIAGHMPIPQLSGKRTLITMQFENRTRGWIDVNLGDINIKQI